MVISRKELQTALEVVKPGLAAKEIIEQSTSFAFFGGQVITYNDEVCISYPVPGLNLTGAVEGEKLYALLAKWEKEEVDIEDLEGSLILKAGRSRACLVFQSELKLPFQDVERGIKSWEDLPAEFVDAISFLKEFCGNDLGRPVLTCVHVTREGILEASDNYRVIRHTMECGIGVDGFLIPSPSISVAVRIQPVQIARSPGWVHFKSEEGAVVSCRVLENDRFPTITHVLNYEKEEIQLPRTLGEALLRADVFSKREFLLDETVVLTLSEKRIKIRAEAPGKGWFEEELNLRYDGAPRVLYITPYLLKNVLPKSSKVLIGDNRMTLCGDRWECVVCLKSMK
jgi:DNA polymerase III sliding clamp (beta) subunit (PCNA family)